MDIASQFSSIKEGVKGDRFLWLIILFLTFASLLAVYSASISVSKVGGDNTAFFLMRHVPYIIMGLVVIWACSKIHYTQYNKWAPFLLLAAVIFLLWALFFGVNVNNARRWIQLPLLDVTFQPSDFAKIALVCYIARSISAKQDYIKSFRSAFIPLILPVLIICGLIAPSNFSTAALLFVTCMLMLFVGRVSLSSIFGLFVLGVILFGLLIFIGQFFPDAVRVNTWVSRINDFMNSDDGGYQIQQAKIAIARGGLTGVGPGNSMLRNFIPYSYADFIYAIICEEWGIILGGAGIIVIYLLLLFHCVSIVTRTPKAFGAMLTIGICLNIIMQAFANMAVSLELVPVTGLTLPFISMGGTSMLLTSVSFGMIISVSKHINELKLEADSATENNITVSLDEDFD